ncbi:unnamed protein product [Coregonus sp. 'balchen']|nr:unnamed protein product [Coregonus sp. 'balchen']
MELYLAFMLGILPTAAQEWRRPVIKLNSEVVVGPDVVLNPGTPLVLKCEGDGPVNWLTRLSKHKSLISKGNGRVRTFRVERPSAEHTGTYKCEYTSGNVKGRDLFSTVHVYVKDPDSLFWTSSTSLHVVRKEGEDHLLPCMLTDPEATDLGLRMDNCTSVPPGMNYIADPRRGILIRNLHPSYNADYVCSAKLHGVERTSKAFNLNIIQRLRFPPYVFLEMDEYVRIVGEKLSIHCTTHNPNFNFNRFTIEQNVQSVDTNRLDIESILTIPAVDQSDTGNITCIGTNEAGVNKSTTSLLVVEEPYIRLSPQPSSKLAHQGLSIEVNEGEDRKLSVLIEAYPQIIGKHWETPTASSTQEQTFTRYNNRWVELIQQQDEERPVAVVRWENITTLTCTSFGYPAPIILWYQCSGIRTTCNENATGLQMPAPLLAQTVEVQREEYGAVEVQSVLTVGPSSRRMTVECVAFNLVGVGKDTFAMEVSDKMFPSTLSGAAGVLAFLLLLLMVLLYKYKQKPRYEIRWKIIQANEGNNYTFIDPTQMPYNENDSGIASVCSDSYLEMRPGPQLVNSSLDSVCEEGGPDSWPLDMDDLLRFSYQVAQGLDFLAAKNPTERPTFSKINQLIERLLGEQPERPDQQHQNVQLQQDMMVEELEPCDDDDEPKCCDGSCDQLCEHEEEEQPLMKTNNYQFC